MSRNLVFSTVLAATLASPALADGLTLTSPDIAEGQQLSNEFVFQGFGCEGENTAPTLAWSGAPDGTQSFAVTVYDPDAPTGSGWWHWFAFNIPADVTELPGGGEMPAGVVELANDYGATGFGGACPLQEKCTATSLPSTRSVRRSNWTPLSATRWPASWSMPTAWLRRPSPRFTIAELKTVPAHAGAAPL